MKTRLVCATGLVVFAVLAGGCSGQERRVRVGGTDRIFATTVLGTMSVTTPRAFDVPTVASALEATLESRGYIVRSSSMVLDHAKLVASAPDSSWFERVRADVRTSDAGTTMTIRIVLPGAEAEKEAIADATLRRLGL